MAVRGTVKHVLTKVLGKLGMGGDVGGGGEEGVRVMQEASRRLFAAGRPDQKEGDNCTFAYIGNTLLETRLNDMTARSSLNVTYSSSGFPGVTLYLYDIDHDKTKLDLISPRLPVDQQSVQKLMRYGADQAINLTNDFLQSHPLFLPDDVAPYVPNPFVEIIPRGTEGWGFMVIPTASLPTHVLQPRRSSLHPFPTHPFPLLHPLVFVLSRK